jgi:hypothetical protein
MGRKILLLEPNYKNKYPPMGLMKLSTYYRGRGDDVRFYKGDLKTFAAKLLFEEYFEAIKASKGTGENTSKVIYNFIAKHGATVFIEYIKTSKQAPIQKVADSSHAQSEVEECTLEDIINTLTEYKARYKKEDYPKFDRVAVTTLFTFYWNETIDTILFAKKLCKKRDQVDVGGIASSLVPDHIEKETGIKPYVGLLNKPRAYDNGKAGEVIIDELPLDYSILDEIDYKYPTANAYFGYMTRGCVNHCAFCAVPKLEPIYCDYIGIKDKSAKVAECFGAKKDLLLMDNNVFASACFDKIIDEIKECGFRRGATYTPDNEYDIVYRNLINGFNPFNGKKRFFNDRAYIKRMIAIYDEITDKLDSEEKGVFYSEREQLALLFSETATKDRIKTFHEKAKPLYDRFFKKGEQVRFVDFNQGLDSRLGIDEKMAKISETAIRPLRIAFDHWQLRDVYEEAIRTAEKHNIRDLSNYLLYNFNDHPDELFERMKLNVDLCEELKVTIYSFPMKYHPIEDPEYFRNRDYIGRHWNRKFIRAIQAVLNSTHGKIGRGKTFFEAAFGKDLKEYHKILWMPEALIIQRYKYDKAKRDEYYKGRENPYQNVPDEIGRTTDEWWAKFNALSDEQYTIIKQIIAEHKFTDEIINAVGDELIIEVLRFYQIKRDET